MKVKIYGYTIEISKVNQTFMNDLMGDNIGNYFGCYLSRSNTIYIVDDLEPEIELFALIHEITHFIVSYMCANKLIVNSEEDLCNFMSGHMPEINRVLGCYFKEAAK